MNKTKTKKIKFRRNVQKYVDSDYKKKLSAEELEWLTKFENEYYDNNHSKPGSLHRTILGDKYDKEIVGINKNGNPMTMKQAEFIRTNEMNEDLMAILGNSSRLMSLESIKESDHPASLSSDIPEVDYEQKYFTYEESMKQLIQTLITEFNTAENKITLVTEFTKATLRLYISAQKLKSKNYEANKRPARKRTASK